MARRKKGRNLSGVLILDKSTGISSNSALQRVRRLYDANKAGHTGSLDPLATGVLPVCFGEATKFSQYLLNADKAYRVVARFGLTTDSCDIDGEVLQRCDTSELTQSQIEAAMLPLTGNIEQVPPMYSALKHEGQRLYKLARQGIEVERKARPVCIESFKLIEFQSGPLASAVFDVDCTKGTYIRTLIADLGQSLGCGATVEVLRRTRSGKFEESLALSETELEAELTANSLDKIDLHLLPTECLMDRFERVDLDEQATKIFMLGQAVMLPKAYRFGAEEDIVRVFREEGDSKGLFLGAGQLVSSGSGQMLVQPKRLRSDIN